jgi:hypothetical protein
MSYSNSNRLIQFESFSHLKKEPIGAQQPSQHLMQFNDLEAAILRSSDPIKINETQEISYGSERGIWANRDEVLNWRGERPISEYPLNHDSNPEVIKKKSSHHLKYVQGMTKFELFISF